MNKYSQNKLHVSCCFDKVFSCNHDVHRRLATRLSCHLYIQNVSIYAEKSKCGMVLEPFSF